MQLSKITDEFALIPLRFVSYLPLCVANL
jgi:hypothetical protein